MKGTLHIEISTPSFTTRKISMSGIESAFHEVLDALRLDAEIKISRTEAAHFLTVRGFVCYFPDTSITEIEEFIQQTSALYSEMENEERYWRHLVREMIWHQPGILYLEEWVEERLPSSLLHTKDRKEKVIRTVNGIYRELLDMRFHLPDAATAEDVFEDQMRDDDPEHHRFREQLILTQQQRLIRLRVHPRYFEEVLSVHEGENLFSMMRDGLFYETGVHYPDMVIQPDETLPYNAFCFGYDAYTSIPRFGLISNEEILVNDTPERLKLIGIEGRPCINPGNLRENCIVEKQHRLKLEGQGYTTWDGLGYFILSLSMFLRRHGYRFVHIDFCKSQLDTLKLVYPKTEALIQQRKLVPLCTKILRLLAREGISLRHLNFILEAVLESDYIVSDANQYIIFDERIPVSAARAKNWHSKAEQVTEFVRVRLKRYISHKYTAGQATLYVYLLDQEIEKWVDRIPENASRSDEQMIYGILEGVAKEISKHTASAVLPAILTTVNVRRQLYDILRLRFPQLAVLSYQELSPEMNIQPVARISVPV